MSLKSFPSKLTFVESKGCQFLFILSMGQDGVLQKILISPISIMNIFLGDPVDMVKIKYNMVYNKNYLVVRNATLVFFLIKQLIN